MEDLQDCADAWRAAAQRQTDAANDMHAAQAEMALRAVASANQLCNRITDVLAHLASCAQRSRAAIISARAHAVKTFAHIADACRANAWQTAACAAALAARAPV